jgi:anti-sigma factor RsiW
MSCPEMVELVSDYLEGVLDADVARRFEAHLQLCNGCVTYVEQLRETVAATGHLAEDAIDPVVMDRLLAAFRGFDDPAA